MYTAILAHCSGTCGRPRTPLYGAVRRSGAASQARHLRPPLAARSALADADRGSVGAMDREPTSHKKPVFPSFSQDDIKLLMITFAGTVAANIVTVLFVGLAIVAAHSADITHLSLISILVLPVVTIGGIMVPIVVRTSLRRLRDSDKLLKKIVIGLTIFLTGCTIYFLLVWVGIAAGIK